MAFMRLDEDDVVRNETNFWRGDAVQTFRNDPGTPLVVRNVPDDCVVGPTADLVGIFYTIARGYHNNPYIEVRFRPEDSSDPKRGYFVEVQRFDPDNFFE